MTITGNTKNATNTLEIVSLNAESHVLEPERTILNKTSKQANKVRVVAIDSYLGGISVGSQLVDTKQNIRSMYHLRLDENAPLFVLRRRFDFKNNAHKNSSEKGSEIKELEDFLRGMSQKGQLANAEIYIGVTSDPLMPFDERFHSTMKCLELLSKFTVGRIFLQTRSPLIVLGLPTLEKLKNKLTIAYGLETNSEQIAREFTPHLPTVDERVKAIRTLKVFGFKVGVQAAPLLPYGDWREDAKKFSQLLCSLADFVDLQPLVANSSSYKRARYEVDNASGTAFLRNKLQESRKYHWLRADSARHLKEEILAINPEIIEMPRREFLEDKQIAFW